MKLKTATKTKLYELTYLVPGSLTDSEVKKVQETVQGLVKKHQGAVKSEESWGKKPLAYVIRHNSTNHQEAYYLHLVVEFDAGEAPAFEKEVYLEDGIIRHLFVTAEEGEEPTEAAKLEEKDEAAEKKEEKAAE